MATGVGGQVLVRGVVGVRLVPVVRMVGGHFLFFSFYYHGIFGSSVKEFWSFC